jgi:predicted transcriptional regulator
MIQPRIKPSEERILTLLSEGEYNLRGVSRSLSMPLQTASARLSELHDAGLVNQNKMRDVYTLTPLESIGVVKDARDWLRFKKWKKLGEANNYFDKEYRDAMDLEFEKQN